MLSDGKWGLSDFMMVNETKTKARMRDPRSHRFAARLNI